MRRRLLVLLLLAAAGVSVAYISLRRPTSLVLTGMVTTNDVIVSPQIDGRLAKLLVIEGDRVARDQVIAVIDPRELAADSAYYSSSEAGAGAQVREAAAALEYQQHQTTDAIAQATSTLASAESQRAEATASLENARLELERTRKLSEQGIASTQQMDQTRMAYEVARAHADALARQVEAQQAALALAKSNAQQVTVKASQLQSTEHMQQAAAAQRSKADVRLAYTEVRSPIDGIIDVRAVRPGETVNRGQPLVTVINPDDLWVRVDVEETYIDRVRIGDHVKVRLPSGDERDGVVFYRGANAAFATERDVSRTKRDIKTFEVRLRVDNRERRLAVGMTAYVLLPVGQ